jgi:hypothetical protein
MKVLICLSLLSCGALSVIAKKLPPPDQSGAEQADKRTKDTEVVYGRIKEVKAGQKIVIQVDKAPDRTYNLMDKERIIHVSEDLAVGDPVKVLVAKRTKSVQIVRDSRRSAGRPEAPH